MNDVAEESIVGHGYYISVGQISRSVKDVKISERWYNDVLNLDHHYAFGDLSFFDCGGTRLMRNRLDPLKLTRNPGARGSEVDNRQLRRRFSVFISLR